ncbi:MAG TPA: PQQ-binding-like beta-propeller repeat protein, partial [Chloroflexota bacterium]
VVCAAAWPFAGQNISDSHVQTGIDNINIHNAQALAPRWTFTTTASVTSSPTSDVSATPTVANGVVYFPDWGGRLYAVDAKSGQVIWSHLISDYNGVPATLSRQSPAIVGNLLIIGDHPPNGFSGWSAFPGEGAHMIAVNAQTGALAWITQVDTHFASQITGSAVVSNGVVYNGVSSDEEVRALDPTYPCCTFRGSEVALDAQTGKILWKTLMVPAGWSGGPIWGSTAAVDPSRGSLYVATGNDYSLPPAVQACENAGGTNCDSPDDHFDSMVALDLKTGAIKWATGTRDFDTWTVACFHQTNAVPNCPSPSSPDADFGGGPNLFTAGSQQLVGDGTKAGTYWALDPATGKVVWATQVGPGGTFGGMEWGSSVADGRVFVASANSADSPITLTVPAPGSPSQTSGGFWAALDSATGKILWEQADPAGPTFGTIGQTVAANGVVYAGSVDKQGHVYALDGGSGKILWSFATGGSVASGPSLVNSTLFWGSGYSEFATSGTTGNNKVFAFSVGGGGN